MSGLNRSHSRSVRRRKVVQHPSHGENSPELLCPPFGYGNKFSLLNARATHHRLVGTAVVDRDCAARFETNQATAVAALCSRSCSRSYAACSRNQ